MSKKTSTVNILKRSLRFKILLMLGILLVFNTFAWFIYSSTISTNISASVKSWKIAFETEEEVIQSISFDVEDLRPGMTDYHNSIRIMNYGEVQASVSYAIEELTILNNTYTKQTYTSEQLLQILNDNPFKTTIGLTKTVLEPENDYTDFTFDIVWPYESGDDAADTLWGHNAFEFKEQYPNAKLIVIKILLTATQIN